MIQAPAWVTQRSNLRKAGLTNARTGNHFLYFSSGVRSESRFGIYMRGGCDAPSVFASAPLIQPVLNGKCCIMNDGGAGSSRSDLLLQALEELPPESVGPIIKRLKLRSDYFHPRLFASTFHVRLNYRWEEFPKKVVILSIGPDIMRIVYRHREYPLLVDPGDVWLGRPLDKVLRDGGAARWFKDNFISIGRIRVDAFMDNFTRIIRTLKNDIGAHVLVFNVLNPEPRGLVHSYQFFKDPLPLRRAEFNVALVELSRKLDFSIVDIDRIFQRLGVQRQIDFGHPNPAQRMAVGQEVFRILSELEVFKNSP